MAGLAMAAPAETDNRHAGSLRGRRAVNAILDHVAVTGGNIEPLGSEQKQVGNRFSAFDHGRAEHMRIKELPKARDLQRVADAIRIAI